MTLYLALYLAGVVLQEVGLRIGREGAPHVERQAPDRPVPLTKKELPHLEVDPLLGGGVHLAADAGQRLQGSITFIRPGKLGDKLIATAREVSKSGRSGIYDVRVTADDVVIAEFRGHSRAIAGAWLPDTDIKR